MDVSFGNKVYLSGFCLPGCLVISFRLPLSSRYFNEASTVLCYYTTFQMALIFNCPSCIPSFTPLYLPFLLNPPVLGPHIPPSILFILFSLPKEESFPPLVLYAIPDHSCCIDCSLLIKGLITVSMCKQIHIYLLKSRSPHSQLFFPNSIYL